MPSGQTSSRSTDTPLLDALMAYAGTGRVSFHMPGHTGGRAFPAGALASIGALDTTEMVSTDDINSPEGPALAAMELAADAFGAARTFFLTTGSTAGVLAMVTIATAPGRTLMLPRAVHRSVLHAIALTGTAYRFLDPPTETPTGAAFSPMVQPAAADIREALARDPSVGAVLVCSPDYYGVCADLPAIAEAVHRAGAMLVVDEAHGAHFRFGAGRLPVCAMDAGADLCVQSAHKTLPALTQAALLHVSAHALRRFGLDPDRIRDAVSLYQTSSPSFPIAASLDYARAWMMREGADRIGTLIGRIRGFTHSLPPLMHVAGTGLFDPLRDPLRMVIDISDTGWTGPEILGMLSEKGIDIEMADLRRLVCIPGLSATDTDFEQLSAALLQVSRRTPPACRDRAEIAELDRDFSRAMGTAPTQAAHPRRFLPGAALGSWTPLALSAGRVCVRELTPYPPGVPLVWPGEILDGERAALIASLAARGIEISGVRKSSSSDVLEILSIPAEACAGFEADNV